MDAIDRPMFHQRLRDWFAATEKDEITDPCVGPVHAGTGTVGVAPWIFVRDEEDRLFRLHADVRRSAVGRYLELIDREGDGLRWTVVKNNRGNQNAVAYGAEQTRIVPFYMYLTA